MDTSIGAGPRLGRARLFLADLWRLTAPYFRSEERWRARFLLAAVIAINLFIVFLNVQFNFWYARFYNALERKDWNVFVDELWIFGGLAGLFIAAYFLVFYVDQWLQLRWRRWLTGQFTQSWLQGRAHYRIELARAVDNPDQRVADDVRLLIGLAMSLLTGLMSAIVTLFSFLFLLWTMSGPLSFAVLGVEVTIPGYLLWAALLYAIAGTWLTHVIGRPLVDLNFQRQRLEADFRFDLVRLRENAEPVALYRGEAREQAALSARFAQVIEIWWAYIRARARLLLFTSSYNQVAIIFPYVVAAPRYFSGALQLGQYIQIAEQFRHVQQSLSYVVTAYAEIAELGAVVGRLKGFEEAIVEVRRTEGIGQMRHPAATVVADGLSLTLPDGRAMLKDAHIVFKPGERTLITGESGTGKTTLFRALAGLWPWGSGRVSLPAGARVLFLPQKTYLPIGTLRDAVAYPASSATMDDAAISAALQAVQLAPLTERLDEVAHWAQRLSPGEQQRIAIARALLQRPDWLFLDEATASLDEAQEASLFRCLRENLPETTIVSIGHRTSLRQWHDRLVTLVRQPDGTIALIADSR